MYVHVHLGHVGHWSLYPCHAGLFTSHLSGFGPFGNHVVNASSESVKHLDASWSPQDFNLVAVTDVNVDYDSVKAKTPELWKKYKPKVCRMLPMEAN